MQVLDFYGGALPAGGLAVLIVPVDMEAPKGRLILPQVQAIRAALDEGAMAIAVQNRYAAALGKLAAPPDLVVCDSQVVDRMVAETPSGSPLHHLSILLARLKGICRPWSGRRVSLTIRATATGS